MREIIYRCCFLYLVSSGQELFHLVQKSVCRLTSLGYVLSITANRTGNGIITHDKSGDINGHFRGKNTRYHTIDEFISECWSAISHGSTTRPTFSWANDRKRYTATIPRHRAAQQDTPRFLTPIRDADWSTQPRTGC